MPVARGGIDVASAIQTPPAQLPISIAQIAIGMPALRSPGNMSAPNETMLAIRTTDATNPAVASLTPSRLAASVRDRGLGNVPPRFGPRGGESCARTASVCSFMTNLSMHRHQRSALRRLGVDRRVRQQFHMHLVSCYRSNAHAGQTIRRGRAASPHRRLRFPRFLSRRCPADTGRFDGRGVARGLGKRMCVAQQALTIARRQQAKSWELRAAMSLVGSGSSRQAR